MPISIYNTLTRRKEEFKPLTEGYVGMYVCGPTVYGHSHIGHAKSYVSFDVIVRYLRYRGYRVEYVQNITDVGHLLGETNEGEDRILRQSRLEHKHPMEIAEYYTHSYFQDMDALGVMRPDISPRASGHITEQIEIVRRLIDKGFAYEANGSVYFDVSKDPEYGKLSGRKLEEAEAGTRVEVKSEKRHPNDFALWKKAEPEHIMQWPSPWGIGFPGWHIECSAMSMKYLGETFDIHGGGMDNQFPHHECEIAQSESATGRPFVRYWIHNNLVTVNGQKMSKSLGNVTLLKDLFKKFDPLVIRFFVLQSHYRSTLDFTGEALEAAGKGLEKLHNTLRNIQSEISRRNGSSDSDAATDTPEIADFRTEFLHQMEDDFNSAQAIGVLFEVSKYVNSLLADGKASLNVLQSADRFFTEFSGTILGILPESFDGSGSAALEPQLMQLIIELRADVRIQKLWALSDKIRDRLATMGVMLEDKKDTTTWRKKG